MNSRRTTHLVLVIVNSYLDGQTDDFERKGPGTNRLGFLDFPYAIVHLLVPFSLESTATESGVNLSRTFNDLSVKTNKSTSKNRLNR